MNKKKMVSMERVNSLHNQRGQKHNTNKITELQFLMFSYQEAVKFVQLIQAHR